MGHFGRKVAEYCNGVKRPILLVSLLLWALGAFASPVTLQLLSFDGPWVNGIPTYPYTLQIGNGKPFLAMCDDYYHDGAPGDIWQANLSSMGKPYLPNLRFGQSAGLTAYDEAAWILLQVATAQPVQWADMNYAVWHIFNPSVAIDPQAQGWIDLAQTEAKKGFPGVNFYVVLVATPVNIYAPPTGDQEFLFVVKNGPIPCRGNNCPPGPNPPVPPSVPEPSTLSLLASAVAGAAAWLKSRSRR